MGNTFSKKDSSNEIGNLRAQCNILRNKTEIKNDHRKDLYERILELDNTEEDDILQYMLSLLELLNRKKIDKNQFEKKLTIYTHGISDTNYARYFAKFPRKNSKLKILDLIELIMKDLESDIIYLKRKTFLKEFNDLYNKEKLSQIKLKKKISWQNKELYIYNLYHVFLDSLSERINYRKKIPNPNSQLYQIYKKQIETENDEEERERIKNKLEFLNLIEGDFFKIYIYNFSKFLKSVKDKFYIRFKDNDLENKKDQLLFEDFIQLLSSYEFNGNEMRLISLWNYSFVPITIENINKIIECHNTINLSSDNKILFELTENNGLNKKEEGKIVLTIDNIYKYDLSTLLHDLTMNNAPEYYEYYLNKNLLPSEYDTDLFVKKKLMFWAQLLISILGSQAVIQCVQKVSKDKKYTFILKDQKYLSEEVIKNIRFFIYEANIGGCLIDGSLRLYEYGLFMKDEKKPVALLFFYSFNIVTNIHEIGGHLYIRILDLNSRNTNRILGSPNIDLKDKDLYSKYALERNKESGESVEIALFGRRIRELTIKEALFIIEPSNYIHGVNYFAENFKLCNSKDNIDIISPKTISILKELEIEFDKLPNNSPKKFKTSHYTNLNDSDSTFEQEVIHPLGFYFGKLSKEGFDKMLHYCDLVQEDMKSMNKK